MTWWQTLLENLEHLDTGIKVLLGLLVTLGLSWKRIKGFFTWVVATFKKWDNTMDTLDGRGAVKHPDTGAVLVEATLPLNQRLLVIEQAQADTARALTTLADNQARMITVETTIATLQSNWDRREKEGMLIIQEWETWRQEHMNYSDELRADVDRIKELVEHIDEQTSS